MNTAAEAGVWAELSRTLFVHFLISTRLGTKTQIILCATHVVCETKPQIQVM